MLLNLVSRLYFGGILFTLLVSLIFGRIIYIQGNPDINKYGKILESAYNHRLLTIEPERGDIFDRHGNLLAGNKRVYEVGINLVITISKETNEEVAYIEDPMTIAQTLASILGENPGDIYKKLIFYQDEYADRVNKYRYRYGILADFVEEDKIKILEEVYANYSKEGLLQRGKGNANAPSLRGLSWSPHWMRTYPENSLGSNIIGIFYSWDRQGGRGHFGVEEKYDDLLAGIPQTIEVPLDPNVDYEMPIIPPGQSLILTLDRQIQAEVEKIMDEAIKENGSESGTAIVMDPKTGEILAMTTTNRLNLNKFREEAYQHFPSKEGQAPKQFNPAIMQSYEPGSVFKVLTMSAALDAGIVKPDTPFNDTGSYVIGGIALHNWNRTVWGPVDMLGCMQHSLNVCLAWLADSLTTERFYPYLRAFNVHRPTNIDLAGENFWPMRFPGDEYWSQVDLGTNSYGQGIALTPIQMVAAAAAIPNDGKMMAPHILRAVLNKGRQYDNPPRILNTPIKPETAHTLNEMLAISIEGEVLDKLDVEVPGYRIAGKTGTANIYEGGKMAERTNASFVGWGPVDDPRFIVYVWFEKPTKDIWGSTIAAPVFKEITQRLVILMDIPPDAVRIAAKNN